MRDIRGDLQDRSNRLAEQISATQTQFDKVIDQRKLEHQGKLEDLKSDLHAVRMVMKTEDRLGSHVSPRKQSEPRAPQRAQQAHSQQATSDSLMSTVNALRQIEAWEDALRAMVAKRHGVSFTTSNGKVMSSSVSYAESVLSHLEKVQQLPIEIQVGIAKRVDTYLNVAKAANSEAILATVASTAMEEQAKAIGEGGTMDPRWAAPAIAEAWCYAKISLSKGYLDRLHAQAIIGAIEAFTSSRLAN